MDLPFEVVSRNKVELSIPKKKTVYKVTLKSADGLCTLTITDPDSALFNRYPLEASVIVKVGSANQSTLGAEPK